MNSFIKTLVCIVALTVTTSVTAQPVTASLAPAPNPPSPTLPPKTFFHPATLILNNTTPHTVRAVRLQPTGGGPAIFWPCVVPPNSRQTVTVPLPPFSTAQPYAVVLLAGDSPHATAITTAEATIDWPADLVHREFLSADYTPARWHPDVKRNTVLLLTFGLLALTATLLIRRPAWRLRAAFTVTVCITIATGTWLNMLPVVYEQRLPGDLIAVSALRTTQWSSNRPLVPVYQNQLEFRNDQSIVHPGRSIIVPLRAGQTRLFIYD